MVICGKYENLNKTTKITRMSMKVYRLLIFVVLYSLQCKIEGHAVFFFFFFNYMERSGGKFVRRNLKK